MLRRACVPFLLALLALAACGEATPTPVAVPTAPLPTRAPTQPAGAATAGHITVQHILIGFAGSVSGKNITRMKEEARTLAYQILAQAQGGADFDALVKQYTDDAPPGIYSLADNGMAPGAGEYARAGMVPAFGNVGFALKPGEIGIADYDPQTSPYGWHIIKRLK
jgi:hypothetical protein